jgi:hypothetical protein
VAWSRFFVTCALANLYNAILPVAISRGEVCPMNEARPEKGERDRGETPGITPKSCC